MKGILVSILRDARLGDCTNSGISGKVDRAILTGYGLPELFEPDNKTPELKLVKRQLFGKTYYHCEPVNDPDSNNIGWMMGGNFVYSHDSRFNNLTGYPIPVHDRQETTKRYNQLSE
jgi:hypothetical protein